MTKPIKNIYIVASLAVLTLTACETLRYPPRKELNALPVFKVNEVPESAAEYVTHYPAGRLITIELVTEGSLFAEPSQTPVLVSLTRDLFVYKQWASFDGKSWSPAHKLFDLEVGGGLSKSGGRVKFLLDAR